jgi:hypothetical protein
MIEESFPSLLKMSISRIEHAGVLYQRSHQSQYLGCMFDSERESSVAWTKRAALFEIVVVAITLTGNVTLPIFAASCRMWDEMVAATSVEVIIAVN